jgi:hypothetical protein
MSPIFTESMITEKRSIPTSKLGPVGKLIVMWLHFTAAP